MPSPADQLRALERHGLRRELRTLDSPHGPRVIRHGRPLWNFASNDYLGLATHPAIRAAFHEGLDRWGHGSAASRLITGDQPPHRHLEEQLASGKGTAATLTFSSGYAAATGIIPALVEKGDHLILDKLCHASLIDGAKLSNATLRVFPHNRLDKLEHLLASIRAKNPESRILILTESVFSMDGDLCPLREILDLKDKYGALLYLDEAHGFGVLGPTGMGLAEELGVSERIDFHMGTLSKAAGLSGAYLACSRDWRDLLLNRARSFIYSTAPPPALAHAAAASLELIRSAAGAELRRTLRSRIHQLHPDAPGTPIVPHIIGENDATLRSAAALEARGFLIPAIRYPTVARGAARLRISLSAAHPAEAVDTLREALAEIGA